MQKNSEPASVPRRFTRVDVCVAVGLVLVSAAAFWVIHRAPLSVGVWVDDGVYLATSKSLADGHGYRHPELPGDPLQTKYPPLYPLLLALIWRGAPSFPDNLAWVQVANVTLWLLGSWLAYRLMVFRWGMHRWLAGAAVAAAFLSPATLGVLQTAMSESLYFFLAMAALCVASRSLARNASDASPRGGFVRAALGGLLASAAYLTRSIGVSLALAGTLSLLVRRRWRAAFLFFAGCAVGLVGWSYWRAGATAANAAQPACAALAYDLDYSTWVPHSVPVIAWVAVHNAAAAIFDFTRALTPAWNAAMMSGITEGGGALALLCFALVVVLALGIAGALATWRTHAADLHLYLAAYLAAVLIWPMAPSRMIVPVYPLLVGLLLAGIVQCGRWVPALLARLELLDQEPKRTQRGGEGARALIGQSWCVASWVALVLALGFAASSIQAVIRLPGLEQIEAARKQRDALAVLIQSQTAPDAVVCARDGGVLYLRTGRRIVPLLPELDPVPHRYPPDRPILGFGREYTAGAERADAELIGKQLDEYLESSGADYVIPLPEGTTQGRLMAQHVHENPEQFTRVGEAGGSTLYQIRRGQRP